MKNYGKLFIPFLLAVLLGSLTVIFAQSSKDGTKQTRTDNNFTVPPPPGFGPHGPHGPHGGVPPRVLEQLDLSDEQINKIAKIRDNAFTAAKIYFDKLKTTDGKLRELQQPEGFNEAEARQALAAKAQVMTELELIRMRADAEIYGVLSAEQIMQAELLKQKHPMGPPPQDGFGPPPDGMRPPAPPQN